MINPLPGWWGTAWGKVKVISLVATTAAAIATAIVMAPQAYTAIGLPEIATRAWAHTAVYEPLYAQVQSQKKTLLDLQIDGVNSSLRALDNANASLQIQRDHAPDDTTKASADVQIRANNRSADALTEQLASLRKLHDSLP